LEGDAVQIVSGGVTDLGRVRTNNEDSFRIIEPLNLFILSDGMGGEAHGEIASSLAVDTIEKVCSAPKGDSDGTLAGTSSENWSEQTRRLQSAVFQANFNIYESSQNHPEQRGMGATLTATWAIAARTCCAPATCSS
jgi:protein phosphatase